MTAPTSWGAAIPSPLPEPLAGQEFHLEPLHPRHNIADHAAWMASIDHIHRSPGFAPGHRAPVDGNPVVGNPPDEWPQPMTAAANLVDLEMHHGEFQRGEAFAYSVIATGSGDVIGCVYLDPDPSGVAVGELRSWVRADHAHLDVTVADAVSSWVREVWGISLRCPGRDAA